MYYSDKITDEKLEKLEKRIASMYNRAYKEMRATAKEYFEKYEERYEKEYEAYQNGAYTDSEFKAWVQTQVQRGKGYETFRDELADKMTNANKIASAYINDATPSVYSLNRDYEAYRINDAFGDFHLTDEMTVRRLAGFDNHIEFKTTSVNRVKDYEWNREQIHSALTAGILQGKSIDKLADSYLTVMKRNKSSAIRNARTSFTSAQNAGRLETYYRATEMGISLTKEWIATEDKRTRISHLHLNGERVAYDKPFSNGLMYPADPSGEPMEVYNCRCTLRAVIPNINDRSVNKKIEDNANYAKAEYLFDYDGTPTNEKYPRYEINDIIDDLYTSEVGTDMLNYITENNIVVNLDCDAQTHSHRGESIRGEKDIRIYTTNISELKLVSCTIVHEIAHLKYDIGKSQHAEAVCLAYEEMHKKNRTYLTENEWENVVKSAKMRYNEFNWEDKGYGNYEQFNFVRKKSI